MFTVPERDPSLTSDPARPPAVVPPACHPGAASSRAVAAAVSAAVAAAVAVTLPTGATAAALRGTPSLGPGAGAAAPGENERKPDGDVSQEEDRYGFVFLGGGRCSQMRAWTAAVRAAHREHL